MNPSESRKKHLYNDLKRRILTLELAPGSDMDEVALSGEYEVSRTPLRDVFRTLAGEGFLEIRNNRGARVSSMDQKTLRDFFLVAPMVYAAVSRLAALNGSDIQVDELERIQGCFVRAVNDDDVEAMVYHNDRFHSLVGEMADNLFLLPSLRRLLIDHARIAQTFYRPANREMRASLDKAVRHHDRMIDAFRRRDEESAERLAIEHWELSRGQIEDFVTPESMDVPLGG
jgi:DNA-binding GntR family transcriptional regulator